MEQLDIFGGTTTITTPAPAKAAPQKQADVQLSLFAIDTGNFTGQTVAVDFTGTRIADAGTEVHAPGVFTL